MNLKFSLCEPFGGLRTETANELVKIADEHAIEFAEWLENLRSSEIDTIDYDLYLRHDTKQLLKIYKKEKEL